MSKLAIDALRAERQLVLELAESLSPADWQTPSDCAGWRVQDVIAHMAATFHSIADPSSNGDGDPGTNDAEKLAEIPVGVRRSWSSADVLSEYSEWSTKAIDALASMQEPPLADMIIPLANLGSHPMHILANALVFDHYCHLRHDLLAPNGGV